MIMRIKPILPDNRERESERAGEKEQVYLGARVINPLDNKSSITVSLGVLSIVCAYLSSSSECLKLSINVRKKRGGRKEKKKRKLLSVMIFLRVALETRKRRHDGNDVRSNLYERWRRGGGN